MRTGTRLWTSAQMRKIDPRSATLIPRPPCDTGSVTYNPETDRTPYSDFGCLDGEHKGWLIVEVESKEEARSILPPAFRSQANIVKLNKFTIEEIDELLRHHI